MYCTYLMYSLNISAAGYETKECNPIQIRSSVCLKVFILSKFSILRPNPVQLLSMSSLV